MTCNLTAVLDAAKDGAGLIEPFLAHGVIGACLVAVTIWYIRKDAKYEKRIDEMLKREREFQEQQAGQTEKYRIAMENVSKTLDVVVSLAKDR